MNKFSLSNRCGKLTHTPKSLIFENKLSGAVLTLGGEEEFVLYVGREETEEILSSSMKLSCIRADEGTAVLSYEKDNISVEVAYFARESTFEKRISVRSTTPVFVKRVALETRNCPKQITRGGEGQPAFIGEDMWCGIEYPAANNYYEQKALYLTQSPYEETAELVCLPVVYGLDCCGSLISTFEGYIRGKMLPKEKTNIYCDWGLHDDIDDKILLTEKLTLDNIERLSALTARSGVKLDYYLMDAYWFKEGAHYDEWKEETFPEGSKNVVKALKEHGLKYGLWFDINCINAHIKGMEEYSTLLHSGALCFSCDKIARLMTDAILKQIRESGIKMIKLDFAYFECENTAHGHSVDFIESKERSVKNFIKMLEILRAEEPELKVLCYNGWTTNLRWIASVEKREGYAVSPYWCEYIDYIYCGDPRPSEIACGDLSESVSIYTDSMIQSFRDSAMPFEAIDDHGTMMGNTCTIYRMDKALYRRGILLNVMRGAKLNLYGVLDLNDEDLEYLSFVDGIYGELYSKNMSVKAICGDPREREVFGYSLSARTEGYAVVLNPLARQSFALVDIPEWEGCRVKITNLIRDGRLVSEQPVLTENSHILELAQGGYVMFKWELVPEGTDRSILFSSGDSLVIYAEGKKAFLINFTKDGKPIRTPEGCPEGFSITADGKKLPLNIKDRIWSGISWQYLRLDGQKKISLKYEGKGSLRVKYSFEEEN